MDAPVNKVKQVETRNNEQAGKKRKAILKRLVLPAIESIRKAHEGSVRAMFAW